MHRITPKNALVPWLIALGLGLLPFLAAAFYCLVDDISLSVLYLPASNCNDEVFYFKQVEGILEFGLPQGYFGYQESTAALGTLGAWSPALYLPIVLWGAVFGWNLTSPVWMNLFSLGFALFLIGLWAKPSMKQASAIAILFLSFSPLIRYCFSCMSEVITSSLALMVLALFFRSMSPECRYFKTTIVLQELLCLYMTIAKPYCVLLFAFPFYCLLFRKKLALVPDLLLHGILAITALICWYMAVSLFSAPYLSSIVNSDWIKDAILSPTKGIPQALNHLTSQLQSLAGYFSPTYIRTSSVGLIWFAFALIFFGSLWLAIRQKKLFWWGLTAVFLVLLLAGLFLYFISAFSRHLLNFIPIGIVLLGLSLSPRMLYAAALVLALCSYNPDRDPYDYRLPRNDTGLSQELSQMASDLERTITVDPEADPWENTVIYAYGGEDGARHQDLYALPKGMGINLCMDTYILYHEPIKSRYMLTPIKGSFYDWNVEHGSQLLSNNGISAFWRLDMEDPV